MPRTYRINSRKDASEAERGRATEAGLNTDSRGGPGSAREAGHTSTEPGPDARQFNQTSTEPRSGTRLGTHTSQGLAGAQGSGGGAERGPREAPPNRPRSAEDDDDRATSPEDRTDLDASEEDTDIDEDDER